MKKIISVLSITAILIGLIAWSQIVAENTLYDTTKKVETLSQEISAVENIDTNKIVSLSNELDKFWTEKERLLSIVMNHNDLNKIGEQIKKVVVYILQNDKKNCEYELITLQFYMDSYKSVIEIRPEHIL